MKNKITDYSGLEIAKRHLGKHKGTGECLVQIREM